MEESDEPPDIPYTQLNGVTIDEAPTGSSEIKKAAIEYSFVQQPVAKKARGLTAAER